MRNFHIREIALIIVLLSNCTQPVKEILPPKAAKIPYIHREHGVERVDNYFWMRLSEEQKLAENKDEQTQRVLDYLEAENAYLKEIMASSEGLQQQLYKEMVARIKQKDESVPYKSNGYWYYSKYYEGQEYPVYCRKKGSLDAEEEVFLDVNQLAQGHSYYQVGGLSISEDNRFLAYGVDTVSRRRYTIFFKDLVTGQVLDTSIPNTEGDVTWANDNKTVFYTQKDEVTLRADRILRHKLGTDPSNDVVVFHELDETFNTGIYKTKSKKFLVIASGSTLTNYYLILEADKPNSEFREFSPRERGLEYSIDHAGDKFYVVT
ncbi:MAG: oligopeptidase B, partial [Cytophagales bacterium]|nr:oligopeptidase B [Cytophagales bacterium]